MGGIWDAIRNFFTGDRSMESGSGDGNRIYVGNLSYKVKEEELRGLFSKYGRIKALHLIRDKVTRRLKGYAFIELDSADTSKALELNGKDFLGRKLVVSIAKVKAPKPMGSRRPRGGPHAGGGGQNRWNKKRRSGPRVYGPAGETPTGDNPIKRYE